MSIASVCDASVAICVCENFNFFHVLATVLPLYMILLDRIKTSTPVARGQKSNTKTEPNIFACLSMRQIGQIGGYRTFDWGLKSNCTAEMFMNMNIEGYVIRCHQSAVSRVQKLDCCTRITPFNALSRTIPKLRTRLRTKLTTACFLFVFH